MGKDAERGNEPEKNPYRLLPKALRPPETGVGKWFRDLVAFQREGIDQGVIPQNIRCVSEEMERRWQQRVWDYYLSKLSPAERRLIKRTAVSGHEKHTRKGPFGGYGIPRDEDLGSKTIDD